MDKQDIIVLGTTHHNTLGVIRALGESPLHLCSFLVLYGEKESYLTQSKYVSRCLFIENAEGITEALLSIATDEKKIIIAVTDEASHQLDINAEVLSPFFCFFKTTSQGNLSCYMDKIKQDSLAEQVGLNVPSNYDPDTVVFPCLLKPLASIAGGKRVIICYCLEDYSRAITEYPTTQFQIQQYLQREEEIVLVGLSVGGDVYIPAYVLKRRDLLGGTTYSTVYPISDVDEQVLARSKDLIRSIGYEGLFGIEYVICNEIYYFIEVNLRTDATCYAVAKAGVNLPVAYVLASQGENIDAIVNNPVRVLNAMVEFRDFEFVINKQVSLITWLEQRNKCKCLYYYSEYDRMPYYYNLKKLTNRLFAAGCDKICKVLRLR